MSKAFEEACIALQVYAGDEKGREIIATRIIDLARGGLINPSATRFQAPRSGFIKAVELASGDGWQNSLNAAVLAADHQAAP